jgi:hypothetical protein
LLNSALLHPQVAAGLGRILRRPPDWRPFAPSQLWKTVTLEALAAGMVLLLTALLTASTPPRGPEFEPPAPPETAPPGFTANAADLLVTLSIKPSRPGQNFINLGVFNTRRPPPAPIEKVQVELQPPGQPGITLTAEALEDGKYQIISEAIQAPGEWQVTVTATRPGQPDAVVSTTWEVLPILRTPIRRPVLISNHPLAPLLTPAAAGLALFAGAAALWLWLRPRTVFTPPAPLHPARRD